LKIAGAGAGSTSARFVSAREQLNGQNDAQPAM